MTQNKIYVLLNIVDGETSLWTLPEILEEINRDRSEEWTDYDESDWREGLDEFTNFQLLAEVDKDVPEKKRHPSFEANWESDYD
tara:strand:- start:3333 stop:3584 length:252 start_codon:yes stop_codon:yes gene_type:complete